MRIPDFTAIGTIPEPQPANAVARYDPNAPFEAQQRVGAAVEKSGQQIQDLYDNAFVNDAYANKFSTAARGIYGDYLSKQGNDAITGFEPAQQQMLALLDQNKEGMTGRQADQFSQLARNRLNMDLDRMAAYRDSQAKEYAQQTTNATLSSFVNDNYTFYGDDKRSADNLAVGKNIIAGHGQQSGWSPAMIEARQNKFGDDMNKARSDAATNYVASLPVDQQLQTLQPLIDRHAGSPITNADDAIKFVMFKQEGAQLVQNDSGHGPSKFGIVGSMNGLSADQVANLTPEQAAQIYKTKYWDGVGADNLPENMRLAAFDTAVNFGVPAAKKMIAEANGDPQKLLTIRQNQYDELAKEDPDKYGAVAAGWASRNSNLAHAMLQGSGQSVGDFRDAIDPGDAVKMYKNAQTQQKLDQQANGELLKQQQEARVNDYMTKMNPMLPPGQQVNINDVWNDKLITPEQKEKLINMQHTVAERGAQTDPTVFNSLFQRVHADPTDPQRISNPDDLIPYVGKGIDYSKLEELRKEVVGLKTPEGAALGEVRNQTFKTVRNWFLGKADTFGIPDPDGEESYTHAMALMNQAEEQGRKAGIPAADLYDPANKNWIGNSARGLVKNLDERTAALNAKLGGENKGPPPVKDRVLNQIYVSPNGPMKWTGTGWLKVTAPAVPTGD